MRVHGNAGDWVSRLAGFCFAGPFRTWLVPEIYCPVECATSDPLGGLRLGGGEYMVSFFVFQLSFLLAVWPGVEQSMARGFIPLAVLFPPVPVDLPFPLMFISPVWFEVGRGEN